MKALPSAGDLRVKPKNEPAILYKVDGDIYWSRLFPAGKVDRNEEDSLHKIEKMGTEKALKVTRQELCSVLEGKVVSFFSRLFLVEKCLRRPLKDMNLEIQMEVYESRSPRDITSEQYLALPEGKELEASRLLPTKN